MNDYTDMQVTHIGDYTIFTYHYETSIISEQTYYLRQRVHNEQGPAVVKYYGSGKIYKQFYYIHDQLHNTNGPAIIVHNKDGNITIKIYDNDYRQLKERL